MIESAPNTVTPRRLTSAAPSRVFAGGVSDSSGDFLWFGLRRDDCSHQLDALVLVVLGVGYEESKLGESGLPTQTAS